MEEFNWKSLLIPFDGRRNIIIPGDAEETTLFCTRQFLQIAQDAIAQHGIFTIALSGGQTPHAIFKELSNPIYHQALDWTKVLCFWSDERNVPPDHPDSNYANAMQAGLANIPLLPKNIFRMPAEEGMEANALAYEQLIREKVPSLRFDLIMLGMGEDGHTASLFPRTHGLHTKDRLVIANYVSQKKTWRMTLTYECIHMANLVCMYVIGANKSKMVAEVLLGTYDPDNLPAQRIGTPSHRALWILDKAASEQLMHAIKSEF